MTTVEQVGARFMDAANRTTTLYRMSAQYEELLAIFDQAEDPDEQASVLQLLDTLEGQIQTKAESIAGLTRELEWRAKARKDEARRLAEGAQSDERRVEWLREYLRSNMAALGLERIETVRFTLNLRLGPPRVEVVDAEQIPNEFRRTLLKVEPDKLKMQDHYRRTGEIVPGTEMRRTQRIDIR